MMSVPLVLSAVAFGGALGALARYGLTLWLVANLYRETFWATLSINLIGCFAIGMISALLLQYKPHPAWTLLLLTGFLGSFTTYSTFTLDALMLWQKGAFALAFTHLATQLIGGFILCFAGLASGQWLISTFSGLK
ncbi:CrcB family protein [Suttonella sp. R2A3]|uniref:fluoride efflux transporter FluC n=1 Tax=Suttonella sp. R2A3 TaxID=2908648 RepID=UPI001F33424D|nr:CrcB family protein [Suttonella sp. R2A3]UJF24362.1 CrcB family protein [Suttonella sp. R2A3]